MRTDLAEVRVERPSQYGRAGAGLKEGPMRLTPVTIGHLSQELFLFGQEMSEKLREHFKPVVNGCFVLTEDRQITLVALFVPK